MKRLMNKIRFKAIRMFRRKFPYVRRFNRFHMELAAEVAVVFAQKREYFSMDVPRMWHHYFEEYDAWDVKGHWTKPNPVITGDEVVSSVTKWSVDLSLTEYAGKAMIRVVGSVIRTNTYKDQRPATSWVAHTTPIDFRLGDPNYIFVLPMEQIREAVGRTIDEISEIDLGYSGERRKPVSRGS